MSRIHLRERTWRVGKPSSGPFTVHEESRRHSSWNKFYNILIQFNNVKLETRQTRQEVLETRDSKYILHLYAPVQWDFLPFFILRHTKSLSYFCYLQKNDISKTTGQNVLTLILIIYSSLVLLTCWLLGQINKHKIKLIFETGNQI